MRHLEISAQRSSVQHVLEVLQELSTDSSVAVTYAFTNRTAQMKLTRAAYNWLKLQISSMAHDSWGLDVELIIGYSAG